MSSSAVKSFSQTARICPDQDDENTLQLSKLITYFPMHQKEKLWTTESCYMKKIVSRNNLQVKIKFVAKNFMDNERREKTQIDLETIKTFTCLNVNCAWKIFWTNSESLHNTVNFLHKFAFLCSLKNLAFMQSKLNLISGV